MCVVLYECLVESLQVIHQIGSAESLFKRVIK